MATSVERVYEWNASANTFSIQMELSYVLTFKHLPFCDWLIPSISLLQAFFRGYWQLPRCRGFEPHVGKHINFFGWFFWPIIYLYLFNFPKKHFFKSKKSSKTEKHIYVLSLISAYYLWEKGQNLRNLQTFYKIYEKLIYEIYKKLTKCTKHLRKFTNDVWNLRKI